MLSIKREKRSRLQRYLRIYFNLATVMVLISIALMICALTTKNVLYSITALAIFLFFGTSCIILNILEAKEFQRVTNQSIDYYKRIKVYTIAIRIAVILLCFEWAINFVNSNSQPFDYSLLFTIDIGVFALPQVIYIFILPQIKDTLSAAQKNLSDVFTQQSVEPTDDSIKLLKGKQGEIYRLITRINGVNIDVFIGVTLFILSVFVYFYFELDASTKQPYIICSILYSLWLLLTLTNILRKMYSYKKREVEMQMVTQIATIKNNYLKKQQAQRIKVFNRQGKLIGHQTREEYDQNNNQGYRKVIHVMIKNRQNKYLVHEKIIDYNKQQFKWLSSITTDELTNNDKIQQIVDITKQNLGLLINSDEIITIHKYTNYDSHCFVEILCVDTNFKNKNIDYNIDSIINAKFVKFETFKKILIAAQEFLPEEVTVLLEKLK